MKLRILVGSLVFFLVASACGFNVNLGSNTVVGSGKRATETRQVSGFDQVTLEGSGEVYMEQGEKEALTVEADDNILPLVRTEVVGNRLVLGLKPNMSFNVNSPIIFHLTVKDLNALTLAGSGKIASKPLETGSLSVNLPGSGDIILDGLTAKDLHALLAGSGKIQVSDGSVDSLDVNMAGSGDFQGGDLKTGDANVVIAGSGKVTLWPSGKLSGRILGSGDIRYYGTPSNVDIQTAGSGSVKQLGSK